MTTIERILLGWVIVSIGTGLWVNYRRTIRRRSTWRGGYGR